MMYEPEFVVGALRATAEFCRDPEAPKCSGHYAADKDGNMHRRKAGAVSRIQPTDADAVAWCAMGYLCKKLGVNEYSSLGAFMGVPFPDYSHVYPVFDGASRVRNRSEGWRGWFQSGSTTAHQEAMEPAASLFDDMADKIEAKVTA